MATNLDPATEYILTRSENLADSFPTAVDGPRLPTADGTPETDTFIDDSAAGSKGFYRVEETPPPKCPFLRGDFGQINRSPGR